MENIAVVDIVEDPLLEFIHYKESGEAILSIRERNCRVPKGTIPDKVKDLLSGIEPNSPL